MPINQEDYYRFPIGIKLFGLFVGAPRLQPITCFFAKSSAHRRTKPCHIMHCKCKTTYPSFPFDSYEGDRGA
jgi:hypothetical protein